MEEVNFFDYDGFKKKLNNCLGEVVFISYFDDESQKVVTSEAVISRIDPRHLVFVIPINNSFFIRGVAMSKIERIVSKITDYIIYDVNSISNSHKKK